MSEWRTKVRFVQPTADDPAIRNPTNNLVMEKIEIGGIRIDRCAFTGAIWLDRGELGRLHALSKTDKALLKELDTRPEKTVRLDRPARGMLTSPFSTKPMMVVRDDQQPHIEFEVCPETGGCYFDAGELSDLTEYTFVEKLKSIFH
ncbi:MAG: hypothetical protein H6810_09470 [Phycisphaeraceae bacterium]|nr:MAG: hypothetical protein H6810_09470 [Phycisphaeraceae bacterium]